MKVITTIATALAVNAQPSRPRSVAASAPARPAAASTTPAQVAVVPVSIGWSDVGSWDALHAIAPRDASGSATHGEVIAIDTSDCLIRSDGPLVAAVGVRDLIVVATADAVLILPRGRSQEVKKLIEAMKS